ncbi:hypothetical protein EYZ11_008263 [Aspergillus tanneri]|uniref:Exopolyphosphatase n=1 Tax=Aspergillus tanneri TaxID=1220188 RepID=A0A4S3JGG9_9EURO|nr:hypothetical protein EYZ11_008263 [Aspergillus tanneri]
MAGQPVHSLLSMLWAARKTHLRFIAGALPHAEAPVYVIGNPSADLDSMICALVYSYFANRSSRCHIPLINIPQVPSGPELCRLRPEFVKAFWISTNSGDPTSEPAGSLLQNHILTVADFAEHLKQRGIDCDPGPHRRYAADAVLVDWNALPIPSSDGQKGKGSLDGLPMVEFTVVGCIDHHVDEGFLGPDIKPLVIEKAGSCSSLVVNTLNTMGLWTPSDTEDRFPEEEPVARLALAPLLIDTVNMNAKDKVTVIDTEAWEFLRRILDSAPSAWDRDAYYRQIHETKSNSLDLLTVDEMLDPRLLDCSKSRQSAGLSGCSVWVFCTA